jgi:hypothetical protein
MKKLNFKNLKTRHILYALLGVVFLVSCSKTGDGFSFEVMGGVPHEQRSNCNIHGVVNSVACEHEEQTMQGDGFTYYE